MKHYNLFVFGSNLSHALIEVFVPILLYNMGFSIREILIMYLFRTISKLFFSIYATYLGKRISFKYILVISSVFFGLSIYLLNDMYHNFLKVIIFGVLQGMFTAFYWVGRHNVALKCLPKRNITTSIAIVLTMASLGTHSASFIGSLFLDHLNTWILTIVAIVLSLISTIPLFFIKEKPKKTLSDLRTIIKTMPKQNTLFFAMQQFRDVKALLLPLFIYIYINNTYSFIGILNIITGIASIVFIHLFAKKLDHGKKDFYLLICIVTAISTILKINFTIPILILLITFIDGLNLKAYEAVMEKDLYSMGQHFIYSDYILWIEIVYNVSLALLWLIFILFVNNITTIIYISILGIMLSGFVPFKHKLNKIEKTCT